MSTELVDPFLRAASAYAEWQVQWCLLIIGGTVALLVGTAYRHPHGWARHSYWLFLPSWFSFALAIYYGAEVQQGVLAYLFRANSQTANVAAAASIEIR